MSPIISGGGAGGSGVVVKRYSNSPAGTITRASTAIGAFSTAWQITGVVVSATQSVLLRVTANFSTPASNDTLFALLRGATQIAAHNRVVGAGTNVGGTWAFDWIDATPGAGTYTYEVQAAQFTSGTLSVYSSNPTTDTFGGSSIFIAEVYNP